MRSPFRYPGGKSKKAAREAILVHILEGVKPGECLDEFREPCVGGGGIYFGLHHLFKRAWINDLHKPLIQCYREMQECPEGFAADCRNIRIHPEATTKGCIGENTFRDYASKGLDVDGVGFLFLNRTIWAGRVIVGPGRKESRLYYSNPSGWKAVCSRKGYDSLEGVGQYLQHTRITCGDYSLLLSEPAQEIGGKVVVYLDPPYVRDTELPPTDKQYECSFTMEDHDRLWTEMAASPHRLVVSYDDHPYVREQAAKHGFTVHEAKWTYSGTAKYEKEAEGESYDAAEGNKDRKKKIGRELILVREAK